MTSNPFAILADYPEEGPAVPDRQKVVREKNRHESGTGRRDREKREGRGRSNWGNALSESSRNAQNLRNAKDQENVNENEEHENVVEKEAEPQIQYVSASNYFDSDDDGEIEYGVPAASKKTVVHIPEQYAAIIAEKREKNVEVRTYNDDEDNNGLETGFLNTQEALKSRQEYRGRSAPPRGASRGAPRGRGRGGRGRGAPRGAPRGGRGRNPNGRFNGEENDRQAPATPEERPHHDGQHGKGPRDRRVGNVQHQRNSQQPRNTKLSLDNFPRL